MNAIGWVIAGLFVAGAGFIALAKIGEAVSRRRGDSTDFGYIIPEILGILILAIDVVIVIAYGLYRLFSG